MEKSRSRIWQQIQALRQQGQSAVEIARYVHERCNIGWSKKNPWTPAERRELKRLDTAVRKVKAAMRRAEATKRRDRHPLNLDREGLSSKALCEFLECSPTELDRWAGDGRFPPDGERYYYISNVPISRRWGRAWHFESAVNALKSIDYWRAQDDERKPSWQSETALFNLVQLTFPDAIRQWSPDWLGKQSVDIYVPSINVAFEYQGEQHYRPVACFGGEEGFQIIQARDARKREILAQHGVVLIEWRFDRAIVSAELDCTFAFIRTYDDAVEETAAE